MLNLWFGLPVAGRDWTLVLIGLIAGPIINHVVYTYAWFQRPFSPWLRGQSRPLSWRIPIVGWLLRRGDHELGWHWIRGAMIEMAVPIGLVLLHHHEIVATGLLTDRVAVIAAAYRPLAVGGFAVHGVLFVLMVAATFIDFDDWTIPDVITVPGTLFGLVAGSLNHWIYPPSLLTPIDQAPALYPTIFSAPWFVTPRWMVGGAGWAMAALVVTIWAVSLGDFRTHAFVARRRGFSAACRHAIALILRRSGWRIWLVNWIAAVSIITAGWTIGGVTWIGTATAVIGLAVGGGVVWAIRIIGQLALRTEAMGFGDVTLMAMIGTMVGWQASLIAFFLAPFAALVITLIKLIFSRDAMLPYGPYLCAGTAATIWFWNRLYPSFAEPIEIIGPVLLPMAVGLLGLMFVLLKMVRWARERCFGPVT